MSAISLISRLSTAEQERLLRWGEAQRAVRDAEMQLIAVASHAATYSYPIPMSVQLELRAARGRLDAALLKAEVDRR